MGEGHSYPPKHSNLSYDQFGVRLEQSDTAPPLLPPGWRDTDSFSWICSVFNSSISRRSRNLFLCPCKWALRLKERWLNRWTWTVTFTVTFTVTSTVTFTVTSTVTSTIPNFPKKNFKKKISKKNFQQKFSKKKFSKKKISKKKIFKKNFSKKNFQKKFFQKIKC